MYQGSRTVLGPAVAKIMGTWTKRRLVVVLATVGALLGMSAGNATAAPAKAAAAPLFITSVYYGDCLDQHYDQFGRPTTTVYAWPGPCHTYGNQQWSFQHLGGDSYRIVNHRSGWCLSLPNGMRTRVYAESCTPSLVNKQVWIVIPRDSGSNRLVNLGANACLFQEHNPNDPRANPEVEVYGTTCDWRPRGDGWRWSDIRP